MAENQFQGHQEKSKSERSANRAKGLCVRERKADSFFSLSLSLVIRSFISVAEEKISRQRHRARC